MQRSRALGAIQKVKPHVKGINFPPRPAWTPTIPKAGPQIPANIMALASKPAAATGAKKSPPKKAAPKKEPVVEANNVRGRKPRFVDIEVDEDRANRAVNLLSSKRTVPHQYTTVKIDLTQANDLRSKLEQAGAESISLNDLIIRAASIALRRVPNANASWSGDELVPNEQISIGVKQPVGNGFESFILPKAGGIGVKNIQGKLAAAEAFAPISVIDFESTNVSEFTSLVHTESGILSLGGVNNGLEGKSMMVTLSADGRTLQMDTALELLDQVKSLVEEPKTMFL